MSREFEVARNVLVVALRLAPILPFVSILPAFAQEEITIIGTTLKMDDPREYPDIKTEFGMMTVTIRRFCDADGNGGIDIGASNFGVDPKKGTLKLEANRASPSGNFFAGAEASAEITRENPRVGFSLRKDQPFVLNLIQKIGSNVQTIRSWPLLHKCLPIDLVEDSVYERSENFQEQIPPRSIRVVLEETESTEQPEEHLLDPDF